MEKVRIYLSGGMKNLSFEEQLKWRKQIIEAINYNHDCTKKPIFFNPINYYNYEKVQHRSEREVMEFNLNALRNSDLIIVNFNDPNSIGTCVELTIAKELRIPVIGIHNNDQELHPWLIEFTTRMCENVREAVEHTAEFYLN